LPPFEKELTGEVADAQSVDADFVGFGGDSQERIGDHGDLELRRATLSLNLRVSPEGCSHTGLSP